MSPPRISDVHYTRATPGDRDAGLLGFASFLLDGRIRIDGVVVRETRDGRLVLSFPAKTSRNGVEHPYVRPIDTPTRLAIEAQVFAALGLASEGSR